MSLDDCRESLNQLQHVRPHNESLLVQSLLSPREWVDARIGQSNVTSRGPICNHRIDETSDEVNLGLQGQ
ncbi:MAG: hypothetical protein R3E01_19815 [Pirellulaceae bacterium]